MNTPAESSRDHFDAKAFCDRMSELILLRKFKWMLAKVPGKNPAYDPLAEAEVLECELAWVAQVVERFTFAERVYPNKVGPRRRAEVAAAACVSLTFVDDLLRNIHQVDAMLVIMSRPTKKVYGAPRPPRKPKAARKAAAEQANAAKPAPSAQAPAPAAQARRARHSAGASWLTAEDRMRWFPLWNRNLVLWEFIADPSEGH